MQEVRTTDKALAEPQGPDNGHPSGETQMGSEWLTSESQIFYINLEVHNGLFK